MVALLGSLIMIVTTLIPLIYTAVKAFPWIKGFILVVWNAARGRVLLRSGIWGVLMTSLFFVGGIGFFVSIYFGWGLELYLKFLDLVFTPFAYIAEHFISSFVSQLPSLPSNAASVLCLFDFSRCFALLVVGFSFELYMRILLYFLVRRGK